MAFSLISHLQNQYQEQLTQLLPVQDQQHNQDLQQDLIAIVLGQLIVLDRDSNAKNSNRDNNYENSSRLYAAIQQQDQQFFSQQFTDEELAQIAALYALDATQLKTALLEIFQMVSQEIKQLDDVASFGKEGVSELIEGQIEYLAGEVPDDIWALIGLTELQGQQAHNDTPVDLADSMASLSKIMSEASQYQATAARVASIESTESTKATLSSVPNQNAPHPMRTSEVPAKKTNFFVFIIIMLILAAIISSFLINY